jgi:hypothetical protein
MNTTINPSIIRNFTEVNSHPSIFTRFMQWCENQQPNRLLWLGIALTGHGCILTPITVLFVLLAGTNLVLFILALVAMGMALVTNLAALPTKITIPVFILTIIIDLAIIFMSIGS